MLSKIDSYHFVHLHLNSHDFNLFIQFTSSILCKYPFMQVAVLDQGSKCGFVPIMRQSPGCWLRKEKMFIIDELCFVATGLLSTG